MKRTMASKTVIFIMAVLTAFSLGSGATSMIHMIMFSTPLFVSEMEEGVSTALYIVEPFSFIIFGLFFLGCVFWSGTVISIDEEGISLSFLFHKYANMAWENVKEICVITDDDEENRKYVYFSSEEMFVSERFKVVYPFVKCRASRDFLALFMKEEDINLIRKVCGRDMLSYTKDELYDAAELLLLDESEKKQLIEYLDDENMKLKANLGMGGK